MSDPLPWLRFGYSGGRPPASAEALVVERDGAARYLAGNPWPASPPFDEIGEYGGRLAAADVERIVALIASVERSGLAGEDRARSSDAGALLLAVAAAPRSWQVTWSPHDDQPALAELREAMRDAIATVRRTPVATMRAALRRSERGVAVIITNTGTDTFNGSLREVLVALDDATTAASPDADADPVSLIGRARPAGLRSPAPDALAPGAVVELELDLPPPAPGTVVRSLLRARWVAAVPPEPPGEIDGWLLPAALS